MNHLSSMDLIVLVLLFSSLMALSQTTESYRATKFFSVGQSAACEDHAYAVFKLSPPTEALNGNLVYAKLTISAPTNYRIAWAQPYISREQERWDIAGRIIVSTILGEIPGLSSVTSLLDASSEMSAYFEGHRSDNVSEISFTLRLPQNINPFSLSYLIHFESLTQGSTRISSVPVRLDYQLRGQIGGTVRTDQGILFLCRPFSTSEDIPTEGLLAYYPFDGNANDESGNGNNLSLHNGITSSLDRFGHSNNAFLFDGIANYLSLDDNSRLQFGPSDLTVCVWIRTASAGRIIERAECDGTKGWQLSIDGFGKNYVGLNRGGGAATYFRTDKVLNDNQWHFVSWNRKSGFVKLFVDGTADGDSGSFTFSISNTGYHLMVGRGDSPCDQLFKGSIDDIRIYNRALSDAEIQLLYHEGGW